MDKEKVNFIKERICDEETPCICNLPNFKCPFLDETEICTLFYKDTNEEVILEKCQESFTKWLEE